MNLQLNVQLQQDSLSDYMKIQVLFEKIEKNRKLLNLKYDGPALEASRDGEEINIYIFTKDKKKSKSKLAKIKKEFKATEIMLIDGDEYMFYALTFQPRKLLMYG